MKAYQVTIGGRNAPRLSFQAMAPDSCTATAQHLELAEPGERVEVRSLADDFRAMAEGLRPSADTLALRRRAMVIEPVTRPAVARDSDGYGSYGMSRTCSLCGDPSSSQVCSRCSAHFEKGNTL